MHHFNCFFSFVLLLASGNMLQMFGVTSMIYTHEFIMVVLVSSFRTINVNTLLFINWSIVIENRLFEWDSFQFQICTIKNKNNFNTGMI